MDTVLVPLASELSRARLIFLQWIFFDADFIVFSCSRCIWVRLGYNIISPSQKDYSSRNSRHISLPILRNVLVAPNYYSNCDWYRCFNRQPT